MAGDEAVSVRADVAVEVPMVRRAIRTLVPRLPHPTGSVRNEIAVREAMWSARLAIEDAAAEAGERIHGRVIVKSIHQYLPAEGPVEEFRLAVWADSGFDEIRGRADCYVDPSSPEHHEPKESHDPHR